MTEENKHMEHVDYKHAEHKEHEKKEEVRINVGRLGKNSKEVLENISFIIILISSILFTIGVGLGNFIQGTIAFSVFGSFFIMIGIIFYIISQFIEVKNG